MSNQVANYAPALTNNRAIFESVLPSHIKVERFMQICQTAIMLNPDLAQCSESSLVNAFVSCAKDGLIPNGKEAAIVIYNKKQGSNWIKEAQYQPMIDGILKLLRQSGEVPYLSAKVVYTDDEFDTGMDINGEYLTFKPNFNSPNRTDGDIKLVFAMAKLSNGEAIIEVMTKDEVNAIRDLSKSAFDKQGKLNPYSVWAKFYGRMALKTVLHRIAKRLPNSSEVMEMLERDIQIKELKSGVFEQDKPVVQTIALDKVQQLKQLVQSTQSNESQMFGWISSSTGRVVNSYEELDEKQYEALTSQLENKIAKQVQKEREEQMMAQTAPVEGELMAQNA